MFYRMCAGAPDEMKKALKLTKPESFRVSLTFAILHFISLSCRCCNYFYYNWSKSIMPTAENGSTKCYCLQDENLLAGPESFRLSHFSSDIFFPECI